MIIRSAPRVGYDVATKRVYRRQVWNALSEGLHGKPTSHVALMPSIEGDEIDVAVQKGFALQRLHVIDRNPAIVATLQRRHPGIKTYGVELFDAFARMVKASVRLDVANLDLCSNVHDTIIRELTSASLAGLWSDVARVAVTLQRGRERPTDRAVEISLSDFRERRPTNDSRFDWMKRIHGGYALTDSDHGRIAIVCGSLQGGAGLFQNIPDDGCQYRATLIRTGSYMTGVVSMLWSAWHLVRVR